MSIFLKTAKGNYTGKVPVWIMRQAGRYLPEYKETRKKAGSFLDLCYNPELAAEVTLQPIRRFNFDAAIIFSDILVIPHAMGVGLKYIEGEGPKLEKTDSAEKIKLLKTGIAEKKLKPVFEAIKIVKNKLPKETALIGFSGSPWTVATYMVEGGGSKNFESVRSFAIKNEKAFLNLIEKISNETIDYLSEQINAGADLIQLFDSWAGVLTEDEFEKFVIKPTRKIVKKIKEKFPEVPITGFPKGAGILYKKYAKKTGVDVIGIDEKLPFEFSRKIQKIKTIQGNLDPLLLAYDKNKAVEKTKEILEKFHGFPHIFNLGHGIIPPTPIENVEAVLKTVRNFK